MIVMPSAITYRQGVTASAAPEFPRAILAPHGIES